MKKELIINYLDELIPNPICELNYNKDYELLIAIMLSAQTTDKRVNKVTNILFSKYDTIEKLSHAGIDDIKNIIRELGSYNKKAIYVSEIANLIVNNYNGQMPYSREELMMFPGVGRKTVNVLLGELNKEDCMAVDTHVDRVSKRLKLANNGDDVKQIENKLIKYFKGCSLTKTHKQLVLFGRYYCKAINPNCVECKLKNKCSYCKGKK